MSEGADPNRYDDPLRYGAKGPFTNWAARAVEDAQEAYSIELGDMKRPNGLVWLSEKLSG